MPRQLDALTRARAILCDVLIGRFLREQARGALDAAIECERLDCPPAELDRWVAKAAELERFGRMSEWGQVLWGGRVNRDGYEPGG